MITQIYQDTEKSSTLHSHGNHSSNSKQGHEIKKCNFRSILTILGSLPFISRNTVLSVWFSCWAYLSDHDVGIYKDFFSLYSLQWSMEKWIFNRRPYVSIRNWTKFDFSCYLLKVNHIEHGVTKNVLVTC